MSEFLQKLFTSDLMPHGHCYLWKPEVLWLHAMSDGLIAFAYYLIPVTLVYLVRKRRDLPFHWIFLMFGLFIFGCGSTHAMEVWTLWHGTYRLAGLIKAVTAVASIMTAALLVPLVPRAVALPSPTELKNANNRLETEIGERRRVEQALQKTQAELESRVRRRTAELAMSNTQLEGEIAERQHAEEVLRKQASLLELANDAIIVRDMNDTITYWNSGAERTYGWKREDAIGRTARQLLESSFPVTLDQLKEKVIQDGRWDGEVRQRRHDRKQVIVASRWALQRDEELRPVAILEINTDITEHKLVQAAKEAAETANRSKGQFLANMSHEIRTPMHGIISMTGLLLDTDLTTNQREYLEIVKESADSLIRIINDILDFSKIDAGKLMLEPVEFNLRNNLGEVMKMLAPAAHQKQLELVLDIRPKVPEFVRADPIRLRQIVVNLLGNAIKFTTTGLVLLRVEREESESTRLHFTVQDTGIGILPEKLQMIFEAFTQADGSTTRNFGGTGLGLTIATRLVEMMKGHIWVESEPGRGTRFHFTGSFPQIKECCGRQIQSANCGPVRPVPLEETLS